MSQEGMKAAAEHAKKLPSFTSLREARIALFGARDEALRALERASEGGSFLPDYSSVSLKELEKWYFSLNDGKGRGAHSKNVLERAIAMYFGEVLVREAGYEWIVEPFAFDSSRFEIGVKRGLVTVMLSSLGDLTARPNNKRRQSLWRDFKRYTS